MSNVKYIYFHFYNHYIEINLRKHASILHMHLGIKFRYPGGNQNIHVANNWLLKAQIQPTQMSSI